MDIVDILYWLTDHDDIEVRFDRMPPDYVRIEMRFTLKPYRVVYQMRDWEIERLKIDPLINILEMLYDELLRYKEKKEEEDGRKL